MITMRTSKKIFIVFFSLLGLFLLSLLIQIDPNKQEIKLEEKDITLPPFKHLVLLNSQDVEIQKGYSNSAWGFVNVDTLDFLPKYELKNDTLVLNWSQSDNNQRKTITCTNLKTISVENSRIRITNFMSDSLYLDAQKGIISFYASSNIDYLQIELAQNSYLSFEGTNVKTLEINLSQSDALFSLSQNDTLKATMQNQSNLNTFGKILQTEVDSDASSKYFSRTE
jgi:hypothetical protein